MPCDIPPSTTLLQTDLRPGESLRIGEVQLTLLKKSGQVARLQIVTHPSVTIKKDSHHG